MKDRYVSFDWAMKRMLRDKSNFAVLEGLLTVQIMESIRSLTQSLKETISITRMFHTEKYRDSPLWTLKKNQCFIYPDDK